MIDPSWATIAEIATAYAARKISPVELTQALLKRIDKLNPKINAFIFVDEEGALEAAHQAEREILDGNIRGPMHGVPVGVKDNIDIAGQATTCHSKLLLKNVARQDAAIVKQLRNAGAILVGKQALHEFAFGGPCDELAFPYARHPWNTDYHPGGSSSGSGAAVAAGFVPLSIGTDAGGSIRNPAGSCGVIGLKPTYDLFSRAGVFPVSFTNDHVGPLVRSVADAALTLDALVGANSGGRRGGTAKATSRYSVDLDRGIGGLRIGFVRHFHETDMIADSEVVAALEDVAKVCKREGARVEEVRLPRLQHFAAVQRVILLAEAWAVHSKWLRERPDEYTAPTRRKIMAGAFLSAGDYVHAQQWRNKLIDAVDDAFQDYDILLTASGMDPICRIDDGEGLARTYARQARSPFNLTGHPALAMMSGVSKSGLPLSVQFVGRSYDEATLLRTAAAYERATNWSALRPPIGEDEPRKKPSPAMTGRS